MVLVPTNVVLVLSAAVICIKASAIQHGVSYNSFALVDAGVSATTREASLVGRAVHDAIKLQRRSSS